MADEEVIPSNPIFLKSIIGKQVCVTTKDKNVHNGIVYVIDPIYKTVALIQDSNSKLEIILYHAIETFRVTSEVVVNENMAKFGNSLICDDPEASSNKNRLMKWLKHMYIEVTEQEGVLQVGEHLTIIPPFTENSCVSDNTIILEKIKSIISLMPPNFS